MPKSKNDDVAIRVEGLSKSFRIPLDKQSGIKQAVTNIFQPNRGFREFQALKDVSFEVKKGEFFGIVGRNGSGKSTLLKILAGVYAPDAGGVVINGSLTPFIELGVGFNPELSGRENVFLNGALLGFSRDEIESMYDEIVDFAELHDFMEERLKNYSSGMQVRLAFSIAIRAKSDILLLDEVLAVGDANFQRKCFNYFKYLKSDGRTVVLVTHDMGAVQEFCDRAIAVGEGRVLMEGGSKDVAGGYSELNFDMEKESISKSLGQGDDKAAKPVSVSSLSITSHKRAIKPNDKVELTVVVKKKDFNASFILGIQILDADNRPVYGFNNLKDSLFFAEAGKDSTIRYTVRFISRLANGTYYLAAALKSSDRLELYDQMTSLGGFEVIGWDGADGSGAVIVDYETGVEVL